MSFQRFNLNRSNRPLKQGAVQGTIQDQIDFNGINDQTLIAAVAGRKIRVHKLFLVGSAICNIRLYSGVSSENDPISGRMNMPAAWTLLLDIDDFTIETGVGKALILNLSATNQVGGMVVYSLE